MESSETGTPFCAKAINFKAMKNSSFVREVGDIFALILQIFLRVSTGRLLCLKYPTASFPDTSPVYCAEGSIFMNRFE
jgi:hypothetical protein